MEFMQHCISGTVPHYENVIGLILYWRLRHSLFILQQSIMAMAFNSSSGGKECQEKLYLGPPNLKKHKVLPKDVAANLRKEYIS